MNIRKFTPILLLLVLFSCSNSFNTDCLIEYTFDKTNMYGSFPEESVVSDVKLEMSDSVMFNPYARFLMDQDNIFVFIDGPIYHFSSDGKFVNKIGGIGHSNDEYTELRDVCLNEGKKEIDVLTYLMIKKYGYDGKLIDNVKTDIFATSFIRDRERYWFYTGVNSEYSKNEIIRTDSSFRNKKEFVERGYEIPSSSPAFGHSPIRTYKYYFSHDIFHVKEDTIVLAYKLRFPNLEMPETFKYGKIDEKFIEALEKENYTLVDIALENERYIFILVNEYIDGRCHFYHWVIDKESKKELVFDIGVEDELNDSYLINPRILNEDNVLYFLGTDIETNKDESVHVKGVDLSKLF